MASPYTPHKTRAFLRSLLGLALIAFGVKARPESLAILFVVWGTWLASTAFRSFLHIWAHEQRHFETRRQGFRDGPSHSLPRRIFWLLLAVAEADGRAGAQEREMVRRFLLDRFVDPVTTHDLRTWETLRVPAKPHELAVQLRRLVTSAECESIFFWACLVAFADGKFRPDEHQVLHQVARGLGLEPHHARAVFHHAKAQHLGHDSEGPRWQRGQRGAGSERSRPRPRSTGTPREQALGALGLEAGASATDIRTRHRELVKRYHPDAHAHLGPVAAAEADRRFREVQEAYELLQKTG
ncbi:MAG: TerB family tellurite resistance protein [Planctomycetota bacterium]